MGLEKSKSRIIIKKDCQHYKVQIHMDIFWGDVHMDEVYNVAVLLVSKKVFCQDKFDTNLQLYVLSYTHQFYF